jgi:hypothetical protein
MHMTRQDPANVDKETQIAQQARGLLLFHRPLHTAALGPHGKKQAGVSQEFDIAEQEGAYQRRDLQWSRHHPLLAGSQIPAALLVRGVYDLSFGQVGSDAKHRESW